MLSASQKCPRRGMEFGSGRAGRSPDVHLQLTPWLPLACWHVQLLIPLTTVHLSSPSECTLEGRRLVPSRQGDAFVYYRNGTCRTGTGTLSDHRPLHT